MGLRRRAGGGAHRQSCKAPARERRPGLVPAPAAQRACRWRPSRRARSDCDPRDSCPRPGCDRRPWGRRSDSQRVRLRSECRREVSTRRGLQRAAARGAGEAWMACAGGRIPPRATASCASSTARRISRVCCTASDHVTGGGWGVGPWQVTPNRASKKGVSSTIIIP